MRNLRLERKFNLLLLLVFLLGIVLIASSLSFAMNYQVGSQAKILLQTMNSVRNYTSEQVQPLFTEQLQSESPFIPVTVPAYSAARVFEHFIQDPKFQNYRYKEAALNPTNLNDQADDFETTLVHQFRDDSNRRELSGYRTDMGQRLYYLARPLTVTKPSCLQCHGDPKTAPPSVLQSYGSEHGFGWQLNEVVAAQVVYVPAQQVLMSGLTNLMPIIGILIGLFVLIGLVINGLLRQTVIRPIQQLMAIAKKLRQDTPTQDDLYQLQQGTLGHIARSADEPGQLARAL